MARKRKKQSGAKLPWGKILLWLVLVTGITGFFNAEVETQDALLAIVVAVIGLLICYRKKLFGKKRKNSSAAKTTPIATRTSGTGRVSAGIELTGKSRSYKLAGVTFEGRQKWLKKIAEKQEAYEYVYCELEPYEWKGEPACRVLAHLDGKPTPVDIGNIPAAAAANVCALIDSVVEVEVEVYGGPEYEGHEKSYGAEVTITVE